MHVGIGDIRKSKGLAKSFDWDGPYKLEGIDLEGPLKLDLKAPDERRRVAKLIERGLGEAAGHVLPLKALPTAISR